MRMPSNRRLEIIRNLLQRRERVSMGSDNFQSVLGILYSWPPNESEGYQIAIDYVSEVIQQEGATAAVGSQSSLSLREAMSVHEMAQSWPHKEKLLRRNLGQLRAGRACCLEMVMSLGPSKMVLVRRVWVSVARARIESGQSAAVHLPAQCRHGGRWYVEYTDERDCTTEFGTVFDPATLAL